MASEDVSDNNKQILLEVYVKLLDSLEKNIDRRYQVNRFNFSMLGALAIAFSFIQKSMGEGSGPSIELSENLLLVTALLVCLVWMFQILRFREISRVKHETAMKLEADMQVLGVTLEHQIERNGKTTVSYTTLELFFPACILVGCILLLFSA